MSDTQPLTNRVAGILLIAGFYYLALQSLNPSMELSPYVIGAFAVFAYILLFGADRSERMAERLPDSITFNNGEGKK